ncbi:MAG: hypothetical protein DWQ28_06670 [Proteobacteria bacterium]|nr:MAG: hypothetical protein DWQ28_06365 [Pseudomonadota bacterium]REJ67715.1 MAG: hypothetical protein DWQ28_06670 [Pseudomonadota bacterium]
MTTRTANFRRLNPITATTREIAELLNRTIDGGLNSWDYVTLAANVTETSHDDPRFSTESVVFFTAINHTPSHSHPYIKSTSTDGTMKIGHSNHGHTQEFAYLIVG